MGRMSYDRNWAWRIVYLSLGTLASESHAFAGFASLTHAANPHALLKILPTPGAA